MRRQVELTARLNRDVATTNVLTSFFLTRFSPISLDWRADAREPKNHTSQKTDINQADRPRQAFRRETAYSNGIEAVVE